MSKSKKKLDYDALEQELQKPRVNSKRKGAAYELKLAKIFEAKFNLPFSRSPGSGAFATTHKSVSEFSGDLIVPGEFKFCIEAKKGYDKDQTMVNMFNPKSSLYDFIRQSRRDARKARKQWMVIWKANRKKDLVFVEKDYFPNCKKVMVHSQCFMYLLEDLLKQTDVFWFK